LTSPLPIIEYINASTGWKLGPDDYWVIGERLLSLRKAFNVREGLKAKDAAMHGRGWGNPPMAAGPHKGLTLDMPGLEKGFFEMIGWDRNTGGPTKEKMKELGLGELKL